MNGKLLLDQIILLAEVLGALAGIGTFVIFIAVRFRAQFRQELNEQLEHTAEEWKKIAEAKEATIAEIEKAKAAQIARLEETQRELKNQVEENRTQLLHMQGEKARVTEMYLVAQSTNHDLVQANEALRVDNQKLNKENSQLLKRNGELLVQCSEFKAMVTHLESRLEECLLHHPHAAPVETKQPTQSGEL